MNPSVLTTVLCLCPAGAMVILLLWSTLAMAAACDDEAGTR